MLEMLLEVADSSMTYRSRYFTVLQAAPVLDLLMNDEANPRSLAFQMKDLSGALPRSLARPSGAGWPAAETDGGWKRRRPICFDADVHTLCQPDAERLRALYLDDLLGALEVRAARAFRTPSPTPISATRKWSGPLDLPRPARDHLRL